MAEIAALAIAVGVGLIALIFMAFVVVGAGLGVVGICRGLYNLTRWVVG